MQVVSSSNQMLKSEQIHDDPELSGKHMSVCWLIVLILTATCVVLALHVS